MARSITFVIGGDENTRITITEQDDGTLLFEIEVLNPKEGSDLRALYFDFDDALILGLSVTAVDEVTDFDVTGFATGYNSINDLGGGTSIKGQVGNKYGAFDVGVALGTPGAGGGKKIQSASFVLDSDERDLTLEDISLQDFGLRLNGSKSGGESTAAITAGDDAFMVDEGMVSSGDNLLANDSMTTGLIVTGGKDDADDLELGANDVTTLGGRTGVLTILADGTATFELTSGFDTLNDGETDTYTFMYSTENDDGSTDMASATFTINGVGGAALPPFFGSILAPSPNNINVGLPVSDAGDVNGDGIADFIIGAAFTMGATFNEGETYVVFGTAAGLPANIDTSMLDGTDGFAITGEMGAFFPVSDFDPVNAQSGFSVSGAGDVNGDGIDDVIVSAPFFGIMSGGRAYVVYGSNGGFAASISLETLGTAGLTIDGLAASDNLGTSVSDAGDVNGDGIADFIIGAEGANGGTGAAYVVFGSASFATTFDLTTLNGMNGFAILGAASGDDLGDSVSSAGDINGDGVDDLIVGAPNADGVGASYVIFGQDTTMGGSFAASIDLAAPMALDGTNGFTITGTGADGLSGTSVSSIGDFNGDGIDDLIIGAEGSATGTGNAYIVFGQDTTMGGSFAASIDLMTLGMAGGAAGVVLTGAAAADNTGISVSGVGDVNGDGFADVLIGANTADDGASLSTGVSYLVFGSATGLTSPVDLSLLGTMTGEDGFIFIGIDASDFSGNAVSGAGDVNGDGIDDLLIGASGANSGEAYLVYGGADLLDDFDMADGTQDGTIHLAEISDVPFA